jgi:hypothetical protein
LLTSPQPTAVLLLRLRRGGEQSGHRHAHGREPPVEGGHPARRGQSINPALDIGQIEGGFVQGMGCLTTEQLVWKADGTLATHAPSAYKIPATGDIPKHLRVDFWPEPIREDNVHGSKAVSEPPFMLANQRV